MIVDDRLRDLSLADLAAHLADEGASPAAGEGVLAQTALGVATVSMAFKRAVGEGSTEGPFAAGRAAELDALRERALELLEELHQARAKLEQDPEKAAPQAFEALFEGGETALSALRLAAVGMPELRRVAAAECASGGAALWGAVEGALLAARAWAHAAGSPPFAEEHLRAIDAMRAEADGLRAETVQAALMEKA